MENEEKHGIWSNSVYVLLGAWQRDRALILIILAQILLTVAASTAGMFLPKAVVDLITGGTGPWTLVFTVTAFTLFIVLCHAALRFLQSVSEPKRAWLRSRLCADVAEKCITTDYANTEDKRFIELRQKVDQAIYSYKNITAQIYERYKDLGVNVLGFAVYLSVLAAVNPLVLLISAAAIGLGYLARIKANKWQFAHDDDYNKLNNPLWYLNRVAGRFDMAKDIRLFSMTGWLGDIYKANMKLMFAFRRKERLIQLAADALAALAAFAQLGVSYAYLIWAVLEQGLSVGDFVLLFAAISGFSGWISGILYEMESIHEYTRHYGRIRAYLSYPDRFVQKGGEEVRYDAAKGCAFELVNVSFRYEGAAESTLENVNLSIKAGEKLAVVGLNGAGKTTLVKLLCGFYDPTEGAVLFNGKDIRTFHRGTYYKLLSAVFQDFNILPLTIAENVAQNTGGNADRERVRACLKQADLEAKIDALPNGMDSLLVKDVCDDAAELSGGETQRLMLARALYKDAPVLILDEPTAALDPIAESRLYEHYNRFSAHKTAVYISHRLASTRFCDRILLIGGKGILEQGSHEELMKLGGRYAELFDIQSKYYKDEPEGAAG